METRLEPDFSAPEVKRVRGPQKSSVKEPVSIRLSQDVVDHFRATGAGWQTRVDAALKEWIAAHRSAQETP